MRNSEIKRILGIEIPQKDQIDILTNLGFDLLEQNENETKYRVPSWRYNDVTREIDLIEEVSRIYGFDKVQSNIPSNSFAAVKNPDDKIISSINDIMLNSGFDEVVSSSLVGKALCQKAMQELDDEKSIVVLNPHSDDFSTLRQNLYPSMLEIAKNNVDNGIKNFRLYETGKVYFKNSQSTSDDTGVVESRKLCAVVMGTANNSLINSKNDDFYILKGVLEDIFDELHISKRVIFEAFSENAQKMFEFLHPAQSAVISILGKDKIGYIGRLHPVLEDKLKFNQPLYVFEINLEEVIQAVNNTVVKYKKLPVFGYVQRDIAFVAPNNVTNEQINKIIKRNSTKEIFKGSKVFDIYEGANIEDGKKSFAYRITLQDDNKTLTDEVIQAEINKIKSALEKEIPQLSLR